MSLSDISQIGVLLENDLEAVVFKRYPEILEHKTDLLSLGADGALMSGSGSAVFGIFFDLNLAERAYKP